MTRTELMKSWDQLLGTFSSVEDARFQVKGARFSQRKGRIEGKGDLKFFLIGRDGKNHRFWGEGNGAGWSRSRRERKAGGSPNSGWTRSGPCGRPRTSSPRSAFRRASPFRCPDTANRGTTTFVYHGAAAGDLDRDGLQDLVVTGINRNYLYLNQGGRFQDVADKSGISVTPPGTAAAAPRLRQRRGPGCLHGLGGRADAVREPSGPLGEAAFLRHLARGRRGGECHRFQRHRR